MIARIRDKPIRKCTYVSPFNTSKIYIKKKVKKSKVGKWGKAGRQKFQSVIDRRWSNITIQKEIKIERITSK